MEPAFAIGLDYGTNSVRAVVVDVSISGVAVESEADLDIDEEVDCHIEIPLQLRAKVVRRQMHGPMGRSSRPIISGER